MEFISDSDVWSTCPSDWLWIYDKVIIARKQRILAAPAGIPVPRDGWYIVRPITNLRMMSRGARKQFLLKDSDDVPDGFFWSEVLSGRHISVDYHWGKQDLTAEGFRDDPDRLDRFSRWAKVSDQMPLPEWLRDLGSQAQWLNAEYIGDRIIELHLRWNDDFANHSADEIIPVWQGETLEQPSGHSWYASPAGERLGFWTKNK
jgi:hypothetical protein